MVKKWIGSDQFSPFYTGYSKEQSDRAQTRGGVANDEHRSVLIDTKKKEYTGLGRCYVVEVCLPLQWLSFIE